MACQIERIMFQKENLQKKTKKQSITSSFLLTTGAFDPVSEKSMTLN